MASLTFLPLFHPQDLFFRYSLNNFLHAQVDQCINFVFTWAPAPPLTPSPSPLAVVTAAAAPEEPSPEAAAAEDKQEEGESTTEAAAAVAEDSATKEEETVIEQNEDQSTTAATDDQEMKDESGSVAAAADDATAASGIPDEDVEDALLLCPPVPEDDDVPINADLEWETTASKLREAEKSAAAADAAERKAKAEPYDNPLLEHVRITQLRFHIIV